MFVLMMSLCTRVDSPWHVIVTTSAGYTFTRDMHVRYVMWPCAVTSGLVVVVIRRVLHRRAYVLLLLRSSANIDACRRRFCRQYYSFICFATSWRFQTCRYTVGQASAIPKLLKNVVRWSIKCKTILHCFWTPLNIGRMFRIFLTSTVSSKVVSTNPKLSQHCLVNVTVTYWCVVLHKAARLTIAVGADFQLSTI